MTKHKPKDKYVCECGAKVTFIHKHMKRSGHQSFTKYVKNEDMTVKPIIRCECGMLVVRLTSHLRSANHFRRMGTLRMFTKCVCNAMVHKFDMPMHLQSYRHCKNMIKINPIDAIDCVLKLGTLKPQYSLNEIDEILQVHSLTSTRDHAICPAQDKVYMTSAS